MSLGQKFEGRKIILELIEQNLMKFYQGVVQHLKKWEKPAPKILKKNNLNNLDEFQSNNDNSVTFDDWCWNEYLSDDRLTGRCFASNSSAFCDRGNALYDGAEILFDVCQIYSP